MADWCLTEVIFEGENTEKLYKDWEKALEDNPEEKDYPWLGILFETTPIKNQNIGVNRMFVDDYEFVKENKTFWFRIEEAYKPHIEVYNAIAETYNLKYYLLAEEPGNKIFINTDTEGKYFDEKYYFELFFENEQEIDTELFSKLQKLNDIRYFDNFDMFKKILEEYNIKTEDDMKRLCDYINETYEDVIVTFAKFENI